jgi:hypothetical protein
MYVDADLSFEALKLIGNPNFKLWVTDEYLHSGLHVSFDIGIEGIILGPRGRCPRQIAVNGQRVSFVVIDICKAIRESLKNNIPISYNV